MLLQFSVTNHRSIKETAIISMKAAADKTMKEILISPDGIHPLRSGFCFISITRQHLLRIAKLQSSC